MIIPIIFSIISQLHHITQIWFIIKVDESYKWILLEYWYLLWWSNINTISSINNWIRFIMVYIHYKDYFKKPGVTGFNSYDTMDFINDTLWFSGLPVLTIFVLLTIP